MEAVDIRYLSIAEVGAKMREGQISAVEVTQACLDLISELDPKIHSFILVTAELALAQARESDVEMSAGQDRGQLHGIPVALKDLYETKGIATTAHSKVLLDHVPEADSAAAEALRKAGAVLLGKLSMHEFAFGVHDPDLPFPQARNPWNPDHVTGGSSTGSGAALAAGLTFGALGSDTGGSVRYPAANCGIVGLKPTFGRVSRRGVVPLSWSLDHAGPMARRVEDTAFLMQALAGFDETDPASANVPVPDYVAGLRAGIENIRLGVPRDWLAEGDGTDPQVIQAFEAALGKLRELGATIVDVPSEAFIDSRAANSIISICEAYAYHEETVKTRPDDLSKNVLNRVREGAFVTATDYMQAQRARVALRAAISGILNNVDAIVSPSAPVPADPFEAQDFGARFRKPAYAHPANITGFPAISLPMGISEGGLPMGLQFMAGAFEEAKILCFAKTYEDATDWCNIHPNL